MFEQPVTHSEKSTDDINCLRDGRNDRRQDIRLAAIQSWFRKRRIGPRRDNDPQRDIYVDVHEPWLFYLGLGALILSTLDAFFTLHLLQLGSEEMNPFMDYFLQKDAQLFFVVKYFITAFCIIFLIMHKNFRLFKIISGYHLLFLCFAAYSVLVTYEIAMLMGLPIVTWFMT